VDYVYDLVGKIQRVNDPTGTYAFAYDNMGRLIGTTTQYSSLPGRQFTNSYGYDAASNRTSFTAPDNSTAGYVYDTLNRLQTLTSSFAGQFGFGYDALSRRTSLTRPNGVSTSYSYDSMSRLLSVLHQSGAVTIDGASYSVDDVGNRTSKQNLLSGVTDNYTYDLIYQLTQTVQGATTTENYSYDAVGNRLSSLGLSPYQNNTSNQLTSTPNAVFTYDNNGNTLTKTDSNGVTGYTWDYENRLTSVTLPGSGGTVTFKYDPFGRRIQKSGPAGITNYLYDGANVVADLNASGAVVASYAQGSGIDEPLASITAAGTVFFEADGLGSVTSLSGMTGITDTYTYNAFGVTTATGTTPNRFRYTGREWDSETGLYYYRARYYDPSVGRFISEDPIRFLGGINFQRYVSNNPLNRIDPRGLSDEPKCPFQSLCDRWTWGWFMSLGGSNRDEDLAILKATENAFYTVGSNAPGVMELAMVHQLERMNLIIDATVGGTMTAGDANAALEAMQHAIGKPVGISDVVNEELISKVKTLPEKDLIAAFKSIRCKNNRLIDQLLGMASESVVGNLKR
jgi:RHS repeat-associated protein